MENRWFGLGDRGRYPPNNMLQFRLRNLLLLVMLAALAIAVYLGKRDLANATKELRTLKRTYGFYEPTEIVSVDVSTPSGGVSGWNLTLSKSSSSSSFSIGQSSNTSGEIPTKVSVSYVGKLSFESGVAGRQLNGLGSIIAVRVSRLGTDWGTDVNPETHFVTYNGAEVSVRGRYGVVVTIKPLDVETDGL